MNVAGLRSLQGNRPIPPRLPVACLIPAAGMSERMGRAKPLAQFAGQPLLYWAVTHAAAACESVIVVLGHKASDVHSIVPADSGITVVTNENYQDGMLSSIRRGFRDVHHRWCFVAPGDMPFLTPDLYRDIFRGADPEHHPDIFAWFPVYRGRRGHPVLINADIRAELESTDAATMRQLLSPYPVAEVPVDNDAVCIDLDTDAALEAHASRADLLNG
ncbi:MAG: nucleotidyltransferase family protein [Spirochaetales bacterium]|nr:MAG: nucleotidyltransferase family protein [Spirochaetales bacterium]